MLKIGNIKDDDIYKVLSNKKVPKVDSNIGNICSDVLKNYKKLNFCRIFEAACPIRKKGSSKKKGGKVTDEDLEGRDFKELIDMHTEHEAVIEYVTRVFSEVRANEATIILRHQPVNSNACRSPALPPTAVPRSPLRNLLLNRDGRNPKILHHQTQGNRRRVRAHARLQAQVRLLALLQKRRPRFKGLRGFEVQ